MNARLGNTKHSTRAASAASTRIPVASRRSRSFSSHASRRPWASCGGMCAARCSTAAVPRTWSATAVGSNRSSSSWRGASIRWPASDRNGLDARPNTPEPPVIRIRIHTPSGREPEPAYRPLIPFDTTATVINAACSYLATAAQVVQEAPGGGDGTGRAVDGLRGGAGRGSPHTGHDRGGVGDPVSGFLHGAGAGRDVQPELARVGGFRADVVQLRPDRERVAGVGDQAEQAAGRG